MSDEQKNGSVNPDHPLLPCLRTVEERKMMLQDCYNGKVNSQLLLDEHHAQAQLEFAKGKAESEKERAALMIEIEQLELQAQQFKKQMGML